MLSALGTGLSALTALNIKLDVNSNNIANVNTDKFKKSRVEMQESPNGGVQANISRISTPGISLGTDERTGEERESSNVTMEEEIVEQMVTQYALEANLITVKTAEKMQKSLLDIIS